MNYVDLIPLASFLSLLTSTAIPAVSAWLTHSKWPTWVVGLLSLILAAVSGFASEWANAPDVSTYNWRAGAATALGSLLIAGVSYVVTWGGPLTERLHLNAGVGARAKSAA